MMKKKHVSHAAVYTHKQFRKNNGITLVALTITIIIMSILVTITLNILHKAGLLSKTDEAKEQIEIAEKKEKYSISEAKEKLELEISNLQIEQEKKGENLKKEDLPKMNNDEIDVRNTSNFPIEVICNNYRFSIDSNFNVSYVGQADETIVTYTTDPEGYTNKNEIKILIKIKNPKGIKTVEYPNNKYKLSTNGKTEIGIDYKVTSNGTYAFKIVDNENKEIIKDIFIDKIDTVEPKDFTPVVENIKSTSFTIVANVEDGDETDTSTKSGIEKYEYFVDNAKFTSNESSYIVDSLESSREYNIYVVAYDKAGNQKKSPIIKQTTTEEIVDYKGYIDKHIKTDKIIYISSKYGDDTSGEGTQNNPYATLNKISNNEIIENDFIYTIVLMDGEYTLTTNIFELNNNKTINILGNKSKTKLNVGGIYSNSLGGSTKYNINIYRLIWNAQANDANCVFLRTNLSLYNVGFNFPFNTANISYFITGGAIYEFKNCTLPKQVWYLLRTFGGNIYLTNCYGGFGVSGWGINDNWNFRTNYITQTPNINRNYAIAEDESTWKNIGTGTNPDGSQANLGVYGGEYSWKN